MKTLETLGEFGNYACLVTGAVLSVIAPYMIIWFTISSNVV